MAILKSKDVRTMNTEETKKKLRAFQEEIMKERSSTSSGGAAESPGKRGAIRRAIAKILTIQKEKEKSKK